TRAELAEQLAALLGADPPARVAEDIYARSEGNPFFAEELLRAGEGRGPDALPSSLQEVLLARVVQLGRGTQQLLRVAAAAGPGARAAAGGGGRGQGRRRAAGGVGGGGRPAAAAARAGRRGLCIPPCAGRRGGVRGVAAR